MKADAPIDEIRAIRHRLSAECDHDPKRFVRYLQQLERKYRKQIQMFHDLEKKPSLVVRERGARYRGR